MVKASKLPQTFQKKCLKCFQTRTLKCLPQLCHLKYKYISKNGRGGGGGGGGVFEVKSIVSTQCTSLYVTSGCGILMILSSTFDHAAAVPRLYLLRMATLSTMKSASLRWGLSWSNFSDLYLRAVIIISNVAFLRFRVHGAVTLHLLSLKIQVFQLDWLRFCYLSTRTFM